MSTALLNPGFGYMDLRLFGAIQDGVTNVAPAIAAAQAAGFTRLFLPASCIWVPTPVSGLALVPGGLDIIGEDLLTSKIWSHNVATDGASPSTDFLVLGPLSTLRNVNLNGIGEFAFNSGNGCSVYHYSNNDAFNDIDIQVGSTYTFNMDVGHNATSAGPGLNGISVIQRGDGGGIYGQFNGGVDGSQGSGIQAEMAWQGATGCGLRVSRVADGIGMIFDETSDASGASHTPQPNCVFTSGTKVHGDFLDFYHQSSAWDGNGVFMSFGNVGGTYTGLPFRFDNAGVTRFILDSVGDVILPDNSNIYYSQGGDVASASSITPPAAYFRVTGSAAISTISFSPGDCTTIRILPTGIFTYATGGNIGLAGTAVVGRVLEFSYYVAQGLWYPSY